MAYHNAHAALIDDNNVVQEVIVIPYMDDDDEKVTAYCNSIGLDGKWIDCSYKASRRKYYPGEGFMYDPAKDEFVPPGWEYIDGEWQDPNPPEPETV